MKDLLSAEKIGYAFDTSAAHFWTLSSFAMCRVLAYAFDRGQAYNQCWPRDAGPRKRTWRFFKKSLEYFVTFMQYIHTLKEEFSYVYHA